MKLSINTVSSDNGIFICKRQITKKKIIMSVFSLMTAFLYLLSYKYLLVLKKNDADLSKNYFLYLDLAAIAIIYFIFYHLKCKSLEMIRKKYFARKRSSVKYVKVLYAFCIVESLFCFFIYYPGCAMNDTIQALLLPISALQPPIYHLYIRYFMKWGVLFCDSAQMAFAMITLVQIAAYMLILRYVYNWLIDRGVSGTVLFVTFLVVPIYSRYSIVVIKDIPFAIFLMLLLPCLYDIYEDSFNLTSVILTYISAFVVSFSRTNGFYIIFVLFIFFLVMLLVKRRRKSVILLFTLLCFLLISKLGLRNLVIENTDRDVSFQESSGIMLSQISAILYANGEVDEEDENFVGKILPLEKWKNAYRKTSVDLIKFDNEFNCDYLNDNKADFVKTWLNCIKKNPVISINAYLCHTYGLWGLCYSAPLQYDQSVFVSVNNNTADDSWWGMHCSKIGLYNLEVLPHSITLEAKEFMNDSFIMSMRISRIVCVLFILGSIEYILVGAEKKLLAFLLLSPVYLSTLINFVATPCSEVFRYYFYLIVTIPLYVCMIPLTLNNSININIEDKSIEEAEA